MATKEAVKHTPGPWKWMFDADGDHLISGPGTPVLAVTGGDAYVEHATDEANARLIAEAPEMLKGLKDALLELTVYCENHDGRYAIRPETQARLHYIVAKAEGR